MSEKLYVIFLLPMSGARLQVSRSWVFNTSFAASGDEIMTKGTRPKLNDITGPYFCASFRKDWCGQVPSWCMFPRIGSLGGDGGRFRFDLFCFLNMRRRRRTGIRRRSSSSKSEAIS